MSRYRSVEWLDKGIVRLLEQRKLPHAIEYVDCYSASEVGQAIVDMVVRGAPAIGVAAAYGVALAVVNAHSDDSAELRNIALQADQLLRKSRPTAVNLFWALDEMQRRIGDSSNISADAFAHRVISAAHSIAEDDIKTNKAIGLHALDVIPQNVTFIHHCNTGGLATVDYGTALGIIRTAHEHGRNVKVFVDETRPRLQGANLTSWELRELGIDHKVIVDGASGYIMRTQDVDMCVVGCDRVAINGDTVNKIGTYNLAVVAHENSIPFYVAAPLSTIDPATESGGEIEIEERDAKEITHIGTEQITPDGVEVVNPCFDVTPEKYITGIITEKGIIRPPYKKNLKKLFPKFSGEFA